MENMNLVLFVGVVAFLSGILCGGLINHLLSASRSRSVQLEGQLKAMKLDFKQYREKVACHFTASANLINRLTDSYRDVHEHLATSAAELCDNEEVRNQLDDSLLSSHAILSGRVHKKNRQYSHIPVQPKDYAPKHLSDRRDVHDE